MQIKRELDRLFNPSSLAMVGASKDEYKTGSRFLKGIIERGFKGRIYPVNPKETEIMGLKSYPGLLSIPGEVDLVYITVPASAVPQIVAECSQKGVKFVVVHSAGFSETGTEGKKLEEAMLENTGKGRTRIVGPNCMGIYSPVAHINTVTSRSSPDDETGPVAFVGQSGWATENVIQMGTERGLRFSKVVSIGNQSDLNMAELLEYFADDTGTGVIGFYIEGLSNGREFFQIAREVSRKKPVIVWKTGRSEVGVRAAASHTGSLAGNSVVFDAALAQSGVISAGNLEELLDLLVGFSCPVLPNGNRVGLLGEAGGGGVASADAAEALGLKVPTLSPHNQRTLTDTLKRVIPFFSNASNPVDLVWGPPGDSFQLIIQCMRLILEEVDTLVRISYTVFDDRFVEEVTRLRDETGKPIIVVPAHPSERRDGMELLAKNGIPTFSIPERAMRVLAAMVRYWEYQQSVGSSG